MLLKRLFCLLGGLWALLGEGEFCLFYFGRVGAEELLEA